MRTPITIRTTALALGLLMTAFFPARGQTSDQAYLAGMVHFFYVAEPNDADVNGYIPELLDNEAIQKESREGAFWTNTSTVRLQELVRGLLCDFGDGGDNMLQRLAARIIAIRDKPVIVYLIDDATAPLNEDARVRWGRWIDTQRNRVYPAAYDFSASEELRTQCEQRRGVASEPRLDNDYAGEIAIGAQVDLKAGSGGVVAPLFLHALVHTQDRTCSKRHVYGPLGYPTEDEQTKALAYATFPDLKTAYREALAYTIACWYSNEFYESLFGSVFPQTTLLMEKEPYPSFAEYPDGHDCADLYSPSTGDWLYTRLTNEAGSKVRESRYSFYPGFASITLRDLPSDVLGQNEFVLSLVFSSYLPHIDRDVFLETMKKVYTETPENVSAATYTIQLLCEAGTGNTSLLPFAYLDYFSGYAAKSLDEFKNLFSDVSLVEEWLGKYWEKYHEQVRSAVRSRGENSQVADIEAINKVVLQ